MFVVWCSVCVLDLQKNAPTPATPPAATDPPPATPAAATGHVATFAPIGLDHRCVPAYLLAAQPTPSGGPQASRVKLPAVLHDWLVPDHFVFVVQEGLLFLDPEQAVVAFGNCCKFARFHRLLQFKPAALTLLLQALAEVFEVRVVSDLKTSQIWVSCGNMLLKPLRFEF